VQKITMSECRKQIVDAAQIFFDDSNFTRNRANRVSAATAKARPRMHQSVLEIYRCLLLLVLIESN
jgi:hypothetical protein